MKRVFALLVLPLLAAISACSPTTDISRTSTEPFAARSGYLVMKSEPQDDVLHVVVRVNSLGAARTIAEDIVTKKRIATGFDRIEVAVLPPDANLGASPAAVMKWSTKNGFSYSGTH